MEQMDRIKIRLKAIDDNTMAISDLCRMFYDMKLECGSMGDDLLKEYPRLKPFHLGLHDLSFVRAIEILAEATRQDADVLAKEMEQSKRT